MIFRESKNKTKQQLYETLRMVTLLDRLLMRRGFLVWNTKYPQFKTFTWSHYGGSSFRFKIADILTARLSNPTNVNAIEVVLSLDYHGLLAKVVCWDVFSMDKESYQSNMKAIVHMLTQPSYDICGSTEDFGNVFAVGLTAGYFETALTFESDRLKAICSVAISVFKESRE